MFFNDVALMFEPIGGYQVCHNVIVVASIQRDVVGAP
jgi:hypothetical protein